jgi:hypothetical protein
LNWNVIVTVREPHYRAAGPLLRQFGEVGKTHYHDVLVMTVDDPRSFLDRLHTRAAEEPAVREWLVMSRRSQKSLSSSRSRISSSAAVKSLADSYLSSPANGFMSA